MTYKFSQRSLDKLQGVHPDLQRVLKAAIEASPYDFGITEGVRSLERQKELVGAGKSRTMQSRHLTGHAVDIAIFIGGQVTWEGKYYKEVAQHILAVAKLNDVAMRWGGDFNMNGIEDDSFYDRVHFELWSKVYP